MSGRTATVLWFYLRVTREVHFLPKQHRNGEMKSATVLKRWSAVRSSLAKRASSVVFPPMRLQILTGALQSYLLSAS